MKFYKIKRKYLHFQHLAEGALQKNNPVRFNIGYAINIIYALTLFFIFSAALGMISSQKQIISWSTQEKLSTKVIFDRASKKYVGVFGNRFIRCWDSSATDINAIKKIKLQKSVVDIIACESNVIVLYTDGSIDPLSEALSMPKRLSIRPNILDNPHLKHDNVKNIDVKRLTNGEQVLTYFVKDGDKEIDLVMLPLSFGAEGRILKIKRKDMNANLSGFVIVEGDTHLMLLTIWSDYRLFLLNLDEEIDSESLPGNFVSIISPLKVDIPLTIVAVAKNCVAIYGANSNQEGASLLLYNTQFKVVKAQQYFKVYFDSSRIWIVNDNILIAMGQNLSVVTFRMSQELLVDLLGTYNTQNHIGIEGDLISEEYYVQSLCLFKEHKLKGGKIPLESNCSNRDYRTYLTFEKKVHTYTCSEEQNQTIIKVYRENALIDDIVNVVETPSEKHLFYKTLMEFYIRQFGNCGATEQEMSEQTFALWTKMKNCSNIMNFVSRFSCAPEFVVAKLFFSIIMKSLPNPTLKVVYPSVVILEPFIINTIFQPIRKFALIENSRNDVSSFHLLYILNYFYGLLTEPLCFKSFCPESCNIKVEMQIIYWFDVLLSAHFQHLVLSKETEVLNLLIKWTKLIIVYKNQIRKLQEVLRLLYNLVQKERIMERSNTYMWYCIEDLCF